jgi:hypothetical protein
MAVTAPSFYRNPVALGTNMMTNWHGQLSPCRSICSGAFARIAVNYTYGRFCPMPLRPTNCRRLPDINNLA